MSGRSLVEEIEERVDALGYEFVELQRAGAKHHPVLRLRVERPGVDAEGEGVTVGECEEISRALEEYLDEHPTLAANYVLEVSSPGVERPLTKRRDWERFAGREVAVKGYGPLAERGRRLEGELLGLDESGEQDRVRLRLAGGDEVTFPREKVARAHLIFRWGDE